MNNDHPVRIAVRLHLSGRCHWQGWASCQVSGQTCAGRTFCNDLQLRVTGGIQQLLPSFLPGLLFGPPVPLERLVLDDERGILYSLAANNGLQVRRLEFLRTASSTQVSQHSCMRACWCQLVELC
jgi:hypothetical protein